MRKLAIGLLAGGMVRSLLPDRLPTVCPFRRLTGRRCPACGLTTSVVAALRLQPAESLRAHPLGLPLALAAAVVVVAR